MFTAPGRKEDVNGELTAGFEERRRAGINEGFFGRGAARTPDEEVVTVGLLGMSVAANALLEFPSPEVDTELDVGGLAESMSICCTGCLS